MFVYNVDTKVDSLINNMFVYLYTQRGIEYQYLYCSLPQCRNVLYQVRLYFMYERGRHCELSFIRGILSSRTLVR